jgi:hypothetical protein
LSHKDGEDDVQLLARADQEARNIVGGYTCMEHEACIASLPNNGHFNRVLEVVGLSYGPRPVLIFTEVLKKWKEDAVAKVLAKSLTVTEKKCVGLVKVSRSCKSGGSKWPSGADIPSAKSTKLSKGAALRVIASLAVARIMLETCISEVLASAEGAKGGGRCPGNKTMPGAKVAPFTIKCIITAIGAPVALSS